MIAIISNIKNILFAILGSIAIGWLGIKFGEKKAKQEEKLTSEQKANGKLHEMLDVKEKVNKLDRAALLRILSSKE